MITYRPERQLHDESQGGPNEDICDACASTRVNDPPDATWRNSMVPPMDQPRGLGVGGGCVAGEGIQVGPDTSPRGHGVGHGLPGPDPDLQGHRCAELRPAVGPDPQLVGGCFARGDGDGERTGSLVDRSSLTVGPCRAHLTLYDDSGEGVRSR